MATLLTMAASHAEEMFPFVIPGLETPAKDSIVDVSWLNDAPAGKDGFLTVRDGHFVDGRGQRVKFLATNFTFGSCFPDHDTADKLAARRFPGLGHLSPEMADRMQKDLCFDHTPARRELGFRPRLFELDELAVTAR